MDWEIGYHKIEDEQPERWLPATVPGAVQLDVATAEEYAQPYWFGHNVTQFDWMEEFFFSYRTFFKKPTLASDEKLYFHSKGIDYAFKVYFNDRLLLEQEGMFTHVDLDLTAHLQEENELKIVIMPIPTLGIPYERGTETYRRNASHSAKPAVSYGWDWHPRLVTRGVWDDTGLVIRAANRIVDAAVSYELQDDLASVAVQVTIQTAGKGGNAFRWVLRDPQGNILVDKQGHLDSLSHVERISLDNPILWWPNGYGAPNLYASSVELIDESGTVVDRESSRVGFKRVRLLMNEGGWDNAGFPITQSVAPASLEVNNRRIFAKGTNWVHPEIFIGLITPQLYREHITLAKEANFNILRVWGGGITNKTSFFEICDELGLLVWAEFPLACNNYPDTPDYLKVLEQEARSIVNRVRRHASLAIWSGGNELFNSWSGMTNQSLALRTLNSVCLELDSKTPFIYTSPQYGMGHGHYIFYDKDKGEDVFQWMSRSNNTAYTEFGISSTPSVESLRSFIPEEELFPPKANTAWETHHGLGAWQKESWLHMPTLNHYFGEIDDLETLVNYSQLLQSEGLKFIYEEARRQKPYCSMALNWCFQEPWPTAANNSVIAYPSTPKPAYYEIAKACRPILASARIPKFEWKEGEHFFCELFMLNDTYDKLESAKVHVELRYADSRIPLVSWHFPGADEFRNLKGPTGHLRIPAMDVDFFEIHVYVDGSPEFNSIYTLKFDR